MSARTLASRLGATRTLGDRTSSRENNFDLLRLVAATMVLVSHSFPLTGHDEPFIPILGDSLGALGVKIFFAISGFLVVKSWLNDPHVRAFALKRALRILPGLIVASTLTALVLGVLVTNLQPATYLSSPGTYGFLAKNWSLFAINLHLPGVFESNVFPGAVNGSMWTLPLEACAYAFVAALGVVGLLRRPRATLAVLGGLLLLTSPYVGLNLNPSSIPGGADGNKVELGVQLIATFLTGATLYIHRARVPLHPLLFVAALLAFGLSRGSGAHVTLSILAIPYGALFLAYWRPSRIARKLTRPGDVSYGMYIYAFPIQQTVSHVWGGSMPALAMMAIALPITYGVAFASWRLVERPALKLKHRFTRSALVAPAAA